MSSTVSRRTSLLDTSKLVARPAASANVAAPKRVSGSLRSLVYISDKTSTVRRASPTVADMQAEIADLKKQLAHEIERSDSINQRNRMFCTIINMHHSRIRRDGDSSIDQVEYSKLVSLTSVTTFASALTLTVSVLGLSSKHCRHLTQVPR
jgi:hypothetical protein